LQILFASEKCLATMTIAVIHNSGQFRVLRDELCAVQSPGPGSRLKQKTATGH